MVCGLIVVAGCGLDGPVPAGAGGEGADTVRMRVAWEVAPGLHPAADSLGQISGVAVDGSGTVYASDFLAARLWILDAEGMFRASLGRQGQGPGEFEAPTGPAVGPDGRLYVRDANRVSVFGLDEGTGHLTRLEATFPGPVYPDWTSTRATRFDETGALLYPGSGGRADAAAAAYVVRFTPEGEPADTIRVPAHETAPPQTAFVRTGPGGGRMLRGLNHVPFAPLPVWDVTRSGTVISGDGRSYVLVETDRDGAELARYERSVTLDAIPAAVRRDSLAALRARLDDVPVPLDQVSGMPESVRSLSVPDRYPAYKAVYVGSEGNVWVRRWSVGGRAETIFDVFERGGGHVRTVVLPRAIRVEPTPFLSSTRIVGVALHPETDESVIISFAK